MTNQITILIPEGTDSATILSSGVIGPKGNPGQGIHSGAGAPALSYGEAGEFYYDTTNYIFYGPKDSNGWGTGLNLTDPGDNTNTTLTYTNGLLTRIDKASGAYKDFNYDSNSELLSIYDGTYTKTFIYDSNRNIVQILVT